ncbi:hypothetical protein [Desulfosediminicola sp.]|uniref:hypothetical protein n=1 Tax=Desulfosediminicola sp. TaxID=2886825 RepID=UPI003AF27660
MKQHKVIKGLTVLMMVATFSALPVYAKGSKMGGGPGNNMQGPPPEAYEACVGKEAGDMVSLKGRRGKSMEGVCASIESQLVAVPKEHLEACAGKQAGDSVSLDGPRGESIKATCEIAGDLVLAMPGRSGARGH